MDQVHSWIKEFKDINIGLPLGHVSGYVGIDVDGELGEILLDELSGGNLPETWEFVTGAGRRLLYEIPVGMPTKKSVNVAEGDHEECSILAYGQQTVMPPSVHYTGRVYQWVEGRSPNDIDCAMAPPWLIDLVRADEGRKMPPGTIDLTQDNPTYEAPPKAASSDPLIITDQTLPTEFTGYESIPMDFSLPEEAVQGKKAKAQKKRKNEFDPEILTQKIPAGSRDDTMTRIIGHFCAMYRGLGKDYIMVMAKNHNRMFCDPPLDDLAIETKVNHFWETEQMKSAQYRKGSIENDKAQFEPLRIAQVVLNKLEEDGYVLKATKEEALVWMTHKDRGPWRQYQMGGAAEQFQIHMMDPIANPELGGDPRWAQRKHFGEVANSLLLLLRSQGRIWDSDTMDTNTQSLAEHKYIPLTGGKLLDWRTGELKPWDPETHLTYVIPIEYDPAAKCPNWEKRLEQWLPDEGSRKIVQEFIGYALIPYMGFEKALLIQGEGANGKSLFLETLQRMFGKEITTSATMSFLFSRFGKKPLIGKILNIVNEAGADYLKGGNADDFKNMVSGGAVIADVKNKEPIVFNNTAKFIFSANHDIKTSDKSSAWLRRMLIIPFLQDFRNSTETKTQIMDELEKEHSGIFNWAVEGLRRLMEQGKFSSSDLVEKTLQEYTNKNDIAADFFAHCLEVRPELTVDGVVVEKGVATSAVAELFKLWTQYRGTEMKKHAERIKEYLERKQKIKCARKSKKYLTMTDASKTSCWVHTRIHVTDPEFLEYVIREGEILSITNVPLRMYIQERLDEINEGPDNKPPAPVTGLPAANGN